MKIAQFQSELKKKIIPEWFVLLTSKTIVFFYQCYGCYCYGYEFYCYYYH